jgi:hypothetical protein
LGPRLTFIRIASYVLLFLNGFLWGGLTLLGVSLLLGVAAQHARGYPNYGQVIYYFAFPLTVFLISTIRPALRWRLGMENLGVGGLAVALVLIPLFLFAYAGGV